MPKSVSSGWGAGGALIGSGPLDKDCADVVSSFPGLPEAGTLGERGGEPSVTTAWGSSRSEDVIYIFNVVNNQPDLSRLGFGFLFQNWAGISVATTPFSHCQLLKSIILQALDRRFKRLSAKSR